MDEKTEELLRDPLEEECEAMMEDQNPFFGGYEDD